MCGEQIEPVDLRELCRALRRMLLNHLQQQQKQQSFTTDRHTTEASLPPQKKHRLCNSGVTCSATPQPTCRYKLRSPQQRKSPRVTQTLSTRSQVTGDSVATDTSTHHQPPTTSANNMCNSNNPSVRELTKSWEKLPESAYDLLYSCLELNPMKRVTAHEALQHPFLADIVR